MVICPRLDSQVFGLETPVKARELSIECHRRLCYRFGGQVACTTGARSLFESLKVNAYLLRPPGLFAAGCRRGIALPLRADPKSSGLQRRRNGVAYWAEQLRDALCQFKGRSHSSLWAYHENESRNGPLCDQRAAFLAGRSGPWEIRYLPSDPL